MADLRHIKGDATQPVGQGPKIIVHCCNDIGKWGRGFVIALSNRWGFLRNAYYAWYKRASKIPGRTTGPMRLGEVQFVQVEENIWVANLIGQHNVGRGSDGSPPIRYAAMSQGLRHVYQEARALNASVHAPKFGAGLAGGEWPFIERMIQIELVHRGIDVTIYNL